MPASFALLMDEVKLSANFRSVSAHASPRVVAAWKQKAVDRKNPEVQARILAQDVVALVQGILPKKAQPKVCEDTSVKDSKDGCKGKVAVNYSKFDEVRSGEDALSICSVH